MCHSPLGVIGFPALGDEVGGGVGVEVAGARLGLASGDLVDLAERLAGVGQQGELDGQALAVTT